MIRLLLALIVLVSAATELSARTALTVDVTYHVNPSTGSDSNDGLTTGTAFQTFQKCYDNAADTLDLAGFNLTCLSAASASYTNGGISTFKCVPGQSNAAAVTLDGNGSTFNQTNGTYVWTTGNRTSGEPACARFSVKGFTCTASSGGCIYAGGGVIHVGTGANFGTVTLAHMTAVFGVIIAQNDYAISGGAQIHADAQGGPGVIVMQVITITCTGSPAFGGAYNTGFLSPSYLGQVFAGQVTFSGCGSVTGNRYSAITGGLAWAGPNATQTYFPGNLPGALHGNAIYGPTSGNPQLVATLTAGNSATLDWADTFYFPRYDIFVIELENIVPATNAAKLLMRISQDGGTSYLTSGYLDANLNTNGIYLSGPGIDNTAGGGMSGRATIRGVNQTDRKKMVVARDVILLAAGAAGISNGGGWYNGNNNAVSGLRFMMSSGNIASGKIRVYGVPTP